MRRRRARQSLPREAPSTRLAIEAHLAVGRRQQAEQQPAERALARARTRRPGRPPRRPRSQDRRRSTRLHRRGCGWNSPPRPNVFDRPAASTSGLDASAPPLMRRPPASPPAPSNGCSATRPARPRLVAALAPLRAGRDGMAAARREAAARRDSRCGCGTTPGCRPAVASPSGTAVEQRLRVGMQRRGEAPRDRALLDDLARIHDDDAVGDLATTTPRLCVMKISAMPRLALAGRRADRGSAPGWSRRAPWSARRRSAAPGRLATAMAIMTRWRMPPDSSCG